MADRLGRLGRFCARHHRMVIAVWLLIVVGTFTAYVLERGEFSNTYTLPGTESQEAADILTDEFPDAAGASATIVFEARDGITAQQSTIEQARAEAAKLPHVIQVSDPFLPAPLGTVSTDDTIAYATVTYDEQPADLGLEAVDKLQDRISPLGSADLRIEFDGYLVVDTEPVDTGLSEEVGLLAAILVLLITLGAVAASGIPIISALVGVGLGIAVIGLLANVLTIPSIAPAGAVMIGLGVGIDYSLFVVGRFRDALAAGRTPEEAAGEASATSGRAVVTAGSTVIVALMGLFVFEVPAVSVIAVTIAIVVIISILSAITLLPAILGLLGPRVNWGRIRFVNRGGDNPAGRRWAGLVTRRAVLAAGAGLVILVVIAIPMLSLRLGPSDVTDSPAGSTELEAGALITEGFGPGYNNPFLGVIELPDGQAADADTVQDITALLSAIEQEPDVAAVIPPSDSLSNEQVVASMFNTDKTTAVFEFVAKSGAKSERTPKLVDRTRDTVIPAAIEGTGLHVLVGGTSAAFVDLDDRIAERLAIFIGLVIVISWIILGTVFRSVAIPLTAGLLNLLVIGAAYGVLVAVFQWGWAASAFGIEQETPIVSFIAPLIFAVLFGLSMDYEVYVMSRIEEEYEAGGDPALAVRDGLGSAARMVVAAATIMFFVFAAFVLSPSIVMKMFGLGLAAAILIDAFVARMLILPAIMRLLGHAAWWPGHRAQEHRASSTAPDRTG